MRQIIEYILSLFIKPTPKPTTEPVKPSPLGKLPSAPKDPSELILEEIAPNKYRFSKSSLDKLDTCHPDLIRLAKEVIKHTDCKIIEGHRTKEKQDEYFDKGTSKVKWPNSRHNSKPAEAIDLVPWPLIWSDWQSFEDLSVIVKREAEKLDIEIEWGGDWVSFRDGPHWQLKRK